MNSYKPWSFAVKDSISDLVLFYGRDTALALSLARLYEAEFVEKLLIEDLCDEGIFGIGGTIKAIIDKPDQILHLHKKGLLKKKCILICTGSVVETEANIDYIKCESLNARSRQWFINWHCKRLGIKPEQDCSWVNNLDDLMYALTLEKFGMSYKQEQEDESIWAEIRMNRFRYRGTESDVWIHFEAWAKENSVSDESLWFIMERVKREIADHKG